MNLLLKNTFHSYLLFTVSLSFAFSNVTAGEVLCQTPALINDGFITTVTTPAEMVQAIHCANVNGDDNGGDTLLLGSDLVFTEFAITDEGHNALPTITAALTIDGQGWSMSRDSSLSCTNNQVNESSEFRLIHNRSILTVKNIVLTHACAWGDSTVSNNDSYGGAIFNHGELSIDRVVFDNNQAQFGAAIANESTGIIHIFNNTVVKNSQGLQGAGIVINGAVETIQNSAFINNHASNTSGAIELNRAGVINNIKNTVFNNNRDSVGMGAIGVRGNNAQIKQIQNSTFSGNFGAINNTGLEININNSIFTENVNDCARFNYTGNNNLSDGQNECPGNVGDVTLMDTVLSTDLCETQLPDQSCLPVFKLQPGSNAIDASLDPATTTDARGFSARGTRDIGATEALRPMVTAPPDITVEATGVNTAVNLGTATAVDVQNQSLTVTADNPGPFPVGTHSVIWTATDAEGFSASATQTVTIVDTTPPVVTMNGDNPMQLFVGDVFTDPGATAYDLVDGDITVNIVASGLVFTNERATWVRGYNVHDSAGNLGYATRMVDVEVKRSFTGTMPSGHSGTVAFTTTDDDCTFISDPVFIDANNLTPQPPATVDFLDGVVVYDIENCNAGAEVEVTVTYNQIIPNGHNPWRLGSIWTTFTATAINAHSFFYTIQAPTNPSTKGSSILIKDTVGMGGPADLEAPVVTAPSDFIQEATALLTPVSLGVANVTDNVDQNLTAVPDHTGPFALGIHTITWSATDSNNNTGTDTQSITIQDTTPPVINLIGSADVTLTVGETFIDEGATAIDLVDGNLSAQITNQGVVDHSQAGNYELIYSVHDSSGNPAQINRTVEVITQGVPASPQAVPAGEIYSWLVMLILIGIFGFGALRNP